MRRILTIISLSAVVLAACGAVETQQNITTEHVEEFIESVTTSTESVTTAADVPETTTTTTVPRTTTTTVLKTTTTTRPPTTTTTRPPTTTTTVFTGIIGEGPGRFVTWGYETQIGNWVFKVEEYNPNATDLIVDEDSWFSFGPSEGFTFALVTIAATYVGDGIGTIGDLGGEIGFWGSPVGGEFNALLYNTCDTIMTGNEVPSPLYGQGMHGSTRIGNICLEMPIGSTESAFLLIGGSGWFSDLNDSAFFELIPSEFLEE